MGQTLHHVILPSMTSVITIFYFIFLLNIVLEPSWILAQPGHPVSVEAKVRRHLDFHLSI